jgi:1-carboxybiuret hydrolase subunit AtzG-like
LADQAWKKFGKLRRMIRKSTSRKSKSRKPMRRKAKPAQRASRQARQPRVKKPDAVGTLAAAASQALALPIEASWRAGVMFNLQLLLKHAALVDQFSLPDETEPAAVFRA